MPTKPSKPSKPKAPLFGSKKKGVACAALAMSLTGCAATQAYVAQHPDQAEIINAVAQGVQCADPLVASAINGASWQSLTAGALSCVISLVDGGKLKPELQTVAESAAYDHLQRARDRVVTSKAVCAALSFDPKPAN
jgi:hypothetical protein